MVRIYEAMIWNTLRSVACAEMGVSDSQSREELLQFDPPER
jgi:hypothetical protein